MLNDSIGFYIWEGFPCRITPIEGRDSGIQGEIYRVGEGFKPFSPTTIAYQGSPINEKEFKQTILDNIKNK